MSSWSGWESAFDTGAAGFLTASQVSFVLQGIGSVSILLWASYICITSYTDFGRGAVSAAEMASTWLRATLVLAVISYLFVAF